jgi:Flp pilus assembly pilin Flp
LARIGYRIAILKGVPTWEQFGEHKVNNLTLKFYLKVQSLREALRDECGQDLIEYVLIGGVVALGAVAGMKTFATNVNTAFTNLGGKLTTYTS